MSHDNELIMEDIKRKFFKDGRLTQMPTKYSKQTVIAAWAAEMFTPGAQYSEGEVNEKILTFYNDFSLIRRMMVDLGYFTRDAYGRLYTRTDKVLCTQ